jgi:hypothetical protein
MDGREDPGREGNFPIKPPEFIGVQTESGIEITGSRFLLSPSGCCSQTALPFRAKIIGRIENRTRRELMINIIVTLFSIDMEVLGRHSEIMILDAGQKGAFDVKLLDYNMNVGKYSIEAGETDEMSFDQSFL